MSLVQCPALLAVLVATETQQPTLALIVRSVTTSPMRLRMRAQHAVPLQLQMSAAILACAIPQPCTTKIRTTCAIPAGLVLTLLELDAVRAKPASSVQLEQLCAPHATLPPWVQMNNTQSVIAISTAILHPLPASDPAPTAQLDTQRAKHQRHHVSSVALENCPLTARRVCNVCMVLQTQIRLGARALLAIS